MAAFDFPATPTVGDIYTPAGADVSYKWTGQVWLSMPNGTIQPLSMKVTNYTTPGTIPYAKPPNLKFLQVELWGGGGGSAGSPATIAGQTVASGGAGSGGYCRKLYRADELAASESLVVGAGGAAGTSAANGGVGGASTFKGLTANGGGAGPVGTAGTTFAITNRGGGGAATGGDLNIQGAQGQPGMRAMHGGVITQAGVGGTAPLGGSPVYSSYPTLNLWAAVTPGNGGFGNGASGAAAAGVQSAQNGAVGNDGFAVLTEYYVDGDAAGTGFIATRRTIINTEGTTNYVKPAGLKFVDVELVGTGGNGGLAAITTAGQASAGSGAGGGGYCRKLYNASDLAESEPVVIGAVAPGSAAAGGDSTFKGLVASGGNGGASLTASNSISTANGATGGAATGGDVNVQGGRGSNAFRNGVGGAGTASPGAGGGTFLAPAGYAIGYLSTTQAGSAGTGYGAGGGGGGNGASQAAVASGGFGVKGVAIFTEYFTDNTGAGGGGGEIATYADWTPVMKFGGNNVGMGFSNQWGRVRKQGRTVTLWFDLTLQLKGSSTGVATIGPLPYPLAASNLGNRSAGSIGFANMVASSAVSMGCMVNAFYGAIALTAGNGTGAIALASDAHMTNTTNLAGTVTYETDA